MILFARTRRQLAVYLRFTDLLDLLANLALLVITIENIEKLRDLFSLPKPILYATIAYVVCTTWRLVRVARARKAKDREQREAVCQVFHWLYEQMFPHEPDRRFTLFVIDPLDRGFIIPKVRYRPGHRELMAEVNSRARYRSGEGSTGRAWDHTGKLIYKEFPEFHNREAFTAYYANELKISRETIGGLSDYMLFVRAIYSYGFVDHRGNLLGIASIDVQGEPKQLDLAQAEKMVRALGPVLEAFAKEKTA